MVRYYLLIVTTLFCFRLTAQVENDDLIRQQLEEEREAKISKIEETNRILWKTQKNTNASVQKLTALNKQIEQHQDLIQSVEKELIYIDDEIAETNEVIEALEKDLVDLKKEYAAMIYLASKSGSTVQKLSYLFASETANQLIKRLNYLKQYKEARQNQIGEIDGVKAMLTGKQERLSSMKNEKNLLLETSEQEVEKLPFLLKEQEELVAALQAQEDQLKIQLNAYHASVDSLNLLISDKLTDIKAIPESGEEITKTPEIVENTASFAESRRKLIWPVEEGFISGKFGKHPHPVLPDIWIRNNGIDIRTNEAADVRAVYEGEVIMITKVPGMNYMVLVQHEGDYFTAYSRLKEVDVKLRQKVSSKTKIGNLASSEEGVSELQFQIWHNEQKMNPEFWLSM